MKSFKQLKEEFIRKIFCLNEIPKDEEIIKRLQEAIRRRSLKDSNVLVSEQPIFKLAQKDDPTTTFVPDIVIKYVQQKHVIKLPYRTEFIGAALFADISGFTSLTERYTQIGTTGIEELTKTLNNYIGPVVARIIAAKGDVFKFAGDALLCLWPAEKKEEIPVIMKTVVNCALDIQESYGIQATSLDVKLRIKFGISAGKFELLICGKENEFIQAICVGQPVKAVQKAQNKCEPGEIILTRHAWQTLKRYHLLYNFIQLKGLFVKILGKKSRNYSREKEVPTGKERQALINSCKKDNQLAIINLFLLPMLRDLDAKQLDYLAEVRKITTVFISFPEIDITKNIENIIFAVEIVYNCTYDMQGIFNKTITFDKGCTCLVVFGLPGYKHQDDSARGLLCGSKIISKMKQSSIKCSIGITTSITFCGIVGNPYRQEYTVISRGVNMAARLMSYYSEHNITCDDVTYEQAKSQLGEENFVSLPVKKLKGMQNIKAVYEYRSKEAFETLKDIDTFLQPCVGMLNEKAIVTTALEKIKKETKQSVIYYHVPHHFIIVKGDSGIGKGRFLYWACSEASHLNFKIMTCKASISMKDSSLSIVSRILIKLLKLKGIASKVKQKLITTLLRDYEEIRDIPFCLLNDLFQVQFPYPKEPLPQDQKLMQNMLFEILLAMFEKLMENQPIMIAIDDAHNMDDESWKLLYNVARAHHHIICIVATNVTSSNRIVINKIFHGQITPIILQLLEPNFNGIVACHFLNVIGIHKAINDFLAKHAKGNPQWIKELLVYLEGQKLIKCTSYPLTAKLYDRYESDFLFPSKKYFNEEFYNKAWIPMEKEAPPESVGNLKNITSTPFVCDIAPTTDLRKVNLPKTMEDLIQQGLNIFKTRQQVLLKTAATLQTEFDVELLANINPDIPLEEIKQDINEMINHHFIEFVEKSNELKSTKMIIPDFISSTIYESMTTHQKTRLHIRIASCLEKKGIICQSCIKVKQVTEQKLKNTSKNIIADEEKLFQNIKIDLKTCTCLETRLNLYDQLSNHWNKAAVIGKAIKYFHLTASSAIKLKNLNKASSCLLIANDLINSMHKIGKHLISKSEEDIILDIPIVYVRSKRLSAQLNFHEKKYDKAVCDIRNASHLLKHSFPGYYRNSSTNYLQKVVEKSDKSEIFEECKFLFIAVQIFMEDKDYNIAYNLAKFLKNALIILQARFYKIIDAYTLLIEAHFYKDRRAIEKQLENEENAIKYCLEIIRNERNIVVDDLKSIEKLYISILNIHLYYGNLDRTVDIGFKAMKIFQNISDLDLLIKIQPYVAQALLHNQYLEKCIEVLSLLQSNAELAKDDIGIALFYGNLAELINYNSTVVTKEQKKKCQEFAESSIYSKSYNLCKEVEFYLTANMALWCIKNFFKEDIEKWYSKAESFIHLELNDYWTIAALGCMLEISIENFYEKPIENIKDLKGEKDKIMKEIKTFGRRLSASYPLFIWKMEYLEKRFYKYWTYKKTLF